MAATVCWARMSSGLAGIESGSIWPASIRSTVTAECNKSARCLGNSKPSEISPTWCPARPTRCSPLATDGGDSTWITRSTAPMSMPNSKLDVATTARSRPDLRSSSISARCSLDTEPWCALARTLGAPATAPAWAIISAGRRAGECAGDAAVCHGSEEEAVPLIPTSSPASPARPGSLAGVGPAASSVSEELADSASSASSSRSR